MYPPANGGGGGSSMDLAGDYRYVIDDSTGALELWKGEEKIGIQSPDGSWFRTAVSTGVGSIHLGGGESGDPAHSLSSIGQNVGFKNEAFNATPGSAMVWFPPWHGLSADLNTEARPSYLEFSAIQPALAPNGVAQSTGVGYDFTTTITSNLCIASVTARAHESYTGKITSVIRSHPKGVDLHVSSTSISVTAGQDFTIGYPSLYFAVDGDELRLLMLKEDGTPLQVKRGSMNSQPWRTLRARTFVVRPIVGPSIGDIKERWGVTDHDGWILLNGRAVSSLTATQQAAAARLGITGTLPDPRNRFTVAAGATYTLGASGGTSFIRREDLPNIGLAFNVTSGNETQGHTHVVNPPATTTSGESQGHNHTVDPPPTFTDGYSHTHDIKGNGGWDGTNWVGLSDRSGHNTFNERMTSDWHRHTVDIAAFTSGQNNSNHTHTVDIAAFDSGNISQNHQHNVSGTTASMNGGVTQQVHLPPYIAFAKFMYLGF
jgi:hypothetical protein